MSGMSRNSEILSKITFAAGGICEHLLDLLFPRRCPVCGRIYHGICPACRKKIPYIRHPFCFRCGRPVLRQEQEYCADCQKHAHAFVQGRALCIYTGEMKKTVYAVKYNNKREYLEYFAQEMAQEMKKDVMRWQPDVIMPIPMHKSAKRVRGYNQAEILASYLSRELEIPLCKNSLKKVCRTANQKELDYRDRKKNLRDAFSVILPDNREQIWEKVLLVDDVYTTGSTIDEAARTLRENGAKEVYFAVICIVPQ